MQCVMCKDEVSSGCHVMSPPDTDVSVMPFSHDPSNYGEYTAMVAQLQEIGWVEGIICKDCNKKLT